MGVEGGRRGKGAEQKPRVQDRGPVIPKKLITQQHNRQKTPLRLTPSAWPIQTSWRATLRLRSHQRHREGPRCWVLSPKAVNACCRSTVLLGKAACFCLSWVNCSHVGCERSLPSHQANQTNQNEEEKKATIHVFNVDKMSGPVSPYFSAAVPRVATVRNSAIMPVRNPVLLIHPVGLDDLDAFGAADGKSSSGAKSSSASQRRY